MSFVGCTVFQRLFSTRGHYMMAKIGPELNRAQKIGSRYVSPLI